MGAHDEESVQAVLAVARALGGAPQASIAGRADRVDAVNAALVNGVAANALDYDDMHTPTLIHPTGAVVAAALALAEARHVSGSVLASAVVCGIEVECRLGLALFPAHYDAGWHITATLGTLGAAAAGCAVLGLDPLRTAHAFGIAATQAGGLRSMLPNACKSFNIGRAAAAGTMSALVAEAQFGSDPNVLDSKFGFFDLFGHPADASAITRNLGERYVLADVSLKPYPCGVVIHPLIDACLQLSRAAPVGAAQVRALRASVHPRALELAGRRHPENAIGGRFSLYHAAALALTRRSAGLSDFDEADAHAPELVALRDLMTIEPDAALRPGQARVLIDRIDGSRQEGAVEHPSGSPERPLTDAQLHDKFIELARHALDEGSAERLFDVCLDLRSVRDVRALREHWVGVGGGVVA